MSMGITPTIVSSFTIIAEINIEVLFFVGNAEYQIQCLGTQVHSRAKSTHCTSRECLGRAQVR